MIDQWRLDTPSCSRRVHLNNAGASLTPKPVHDAVIAHLRLEDELGGYEAFEARRPEIRAVYNEMGRLLGAESRNIAFTQNATTAFAQALETFDFGPGRHHSHEPGRLRLEPDHVPLALPPKGSGDRPRARLAGGRN